MTLKHEHRWERGLKTSQVIPRRTAPQTRPFGRAASLSDHVDFSGRIVTKLQAPPESTSLILDDAFLKTPCEVTPRSGVSVEPPEQLLWTAGVCRRGGPRPARLAQTPLQRPKAPTWSPAPRTGWGGKLLWSPTCVSLHVVLRHRRNSWSCRRHCSRFTRCGQGWVPGSSASLQVTLPRRCPGAETGFPQVPCGTGDLRLWSPPSRRPHASASFGQGLMASAASSTESLAHADNHRERKSPQRCHPSSNTCPFTPTSALEATHFYCLGKHLRNNARPAHGFSARPCSHCPHVPQSPVSGAQADQVVTCEHRRWARERVRTQQGGSERLACFRGSVLEAGTGNALRGGTETRPWCRRPWPLSSERVAC